MASYFQYLISFGAFHRPFQVICLLSMTSILFTSYPFPINNISSTSRLRLLYLAVCELDVCCVLVGSSCAWLCRLLSCWWRNVRQVLMLTSQHPASFLEYLSALRQEYCLKVCAHPHIHIFTHTHTHGQIKGHFLILCSNYLVDSSTEWT